ncbi:hypothetical protein [Mycolicibacterium sp. XJ1819]
MNNDATGVPPRQCPADPRSARPAAHDRTQTPDYAAGVHDARADRLTAGRD